MKVLVLLSVLALGGSAFALQAKDGAVPVHATLTGLYPAPINTHLRVTILNAIQSELDTKCQGRNVTDLSLQVNLSHNQVPGSAALVIDGVAVCP